MGVLSFFLDPRGRIGRQQYWLGMLGVAVAIAALIGIIWTTQQLLLGIPLIVFIAVSVYVLAIKRLHDRNKSGWWTLVFLWAPGVTDRLSDKVIEESATWWILVLIGSVLTIWSLVELGFRRGTDGENDYGPDPLKKSEVTALAA
jgi:uncharacterized membrane protein YhaH (DUF805 family)